ncbi:Nucleoside-diphosphate-sugar epimerase [Agrococcus baldri]|uniref:Nucleoside-diphosphate-sugar epimerase n=1 Tax=Agrococcus baldri TaxID=153730 RepID=A0AA94HPI4_9MICO|nr:sugar nucleotide-binding protein [Agrococcus baldri]SFS17989.1 Nucleoside-diphosphate-sugar epimerase [Agrococcus baldri]
MTAGGPRPAASAPGARVLLVGCGKVGTRLGERLVGAGAQAFALRRTTAALPPSLSPLQVDLLAPPPRELPAADAMVITLTPALAAPGVPDGYLAALRNLAAALPRIPQRVVLVSSTRVFEGRPGERQITEGDPPAPASARAETLLAGERLAAELFGAHIVRPAGIYGPGRERLLRIVLAGEPVDYARRTNRIHETDLVRALQAMLTAEAPPGLVHAVDAAPAPLGDVVTHIARRLGVAPPPRSEPETRDAGTAAGAVRSGAVRSGTVQSGARLSGTVLSGALLRTLLPTLRYPTFESGYDELVAMRQRERSR